jgi:hypothetical protein
VNYTMKRPCSECPFLKGTPLNKTLPEKRLREFASGEFACHKTAELREDEDGEEAAQYVGTAESQHCAGALIALEKAGDSHQMMRISERLGFYDRTKLDMSVDVAPIRGAR